MPRCLLLYLLLLCALAPAAFGQQVDATAAGAPVSLDAPWRFHFGDNPAFAQPGFDDLQWSLHPITQSWAGTGHKGYSGYAWYRMRVVLPKLSEPLAIAFYPPLNLEDEVYIDGMLVATIGRMRPRPVWTRKFTAYAFPVPPELNGRSVEIAIRTWEPRLAATSVGTGVAAHPPLVGTAGEIERLVRAEQDDRWLARLPNWAVDSAGLCVGLFSFGLFVLQRHAREYAYAAFYLCVGAAGDVYFWTLHHTGAGVKLTAASEFVSDSVLLSFLLLFTWGFVRAKADRLLYVCLVVACMVGLSACLVTFGLLPVAGSYWFQAATYLFLSIAVFLRLYALARRGNRDAQLFLIPFFLSLVAGCAVSVIGALQYAGVVSLRSALILYHTQRFDMTWQQLFQLLSALAIGAVLVLRFARSARQEQRLRTEMESARRVQAQLVPAELPRLTAFACDAAYRAASEVGGDFYQIFPRADGSALILVGDVSGKGLRAAMLGTLIVGAAGALAQEDLAPAEMLDRLNRHLHGRSDGGFATCLCALLGPDGALAIANAGHLSPYLNGHELPCEPGLPLGILPAAAYTETHERLAPGDALTFLSDGVVEARTAAGEMFGFERTREISLQNARQIADAAARFGQEDDITVLTVMLCPVAAAV